MVEGRLDQSVTEGLGVLSLALMLPDEGGLPAGLGVVLWGDSPEGTPLPLHCLSLHRLWPLLLLSPWGLPLGLPAAIDGHACCLARCGHHPWTSTPRTRSGWQEGGMEAQGAGSPSPAGLLPEVAPVTP